MDSLLGFEMGYTFSFLPSGALTRNGALLSGGLEQECRSKLLAF
jgi:hypothetical protein